MSLASSSFISGSPVPGAVGKREGGEVVRRPPLPAAVMKCMWAAWLCQTGCATASRSRTLNDGNQRKLLATGSANAGQQMRWWRAGSWRPLPLLQIPCPTPPCPRPVACSVLVYACTRCRGSPHPRGGRSHLWRASLLE